MRKSADIYRAINILFITETTLSYHVISRYRAVSLLKRRNFDLITRHPTRRCNNVTL